MVILPLMCKKDLLLTQVSGRSFFFFVLSDDVLQKIIEHNPKKKVNHCRTTSAHQLVRENCVRGFYFEIPRLLAPAFFHETTADRRIKENVASRNNIVRIFVVQKALLPCCASV